VKRYVKGVLGGLLAILAAFGWAGAAFMLLAVKGNKIWGIEIPVGPLPWVLVTLIFAAGFFLAFRAAYSRNSE
jgi:hypothetical protein